MHTPGDDAAPTEAEWEAFVLGVKDGEFDLDEDGNLPPLPEQQSQPQNQ